MVNMVNMDVSCKVATNSTKNLLLYHFKDDKSKTAIWKFVKIVLKCSIVFAITKRWKLRGTVENGLKSGAPYKLTPKYGSLSSIKSRKIQDLEQWNLKQENSKKIYNKSKPWNKQVIRSHGSNSRMFFFNERTRKLRLKFEKSMVDKGTLARKSLRTKAM